MARKFKRNKSKVLKPYFFAFQGRVDYKHGKKLGPFATELTETYGQRN